MWDRLRSVNNTVWFLLLAMLIFLGWNMYVRQAQTTKISYSAFVQQVKQGNVDSVTVQGDEIEGSLKQQAKLPTETGQAEQYEYFITYLPSFGHDKLMDLLDEHEVEVKTLPQSDPAFWYFLISFLPLILILWIGFVQYKRMQGQGGGGLFNIGKSQAKMYQQSEEQTTFDDVAGAAGAKTELQEIVSYLKEPQKVLDMGGEIPKGVMLVGPPGNGKTLLARAVAGEAHAPFFTITGSDFMEMFVGVGAKRVRSLFEDAKKNAPSIIFIDEIDAIGRRRGAGLGGGHDEREQTLNQLLSELDGFEKNESVIVMTATNRPDILDPALMRPGRFDRRIVVDLPSTKERREILDIYAKNKSIAEDIDLDSLARSTPGFSGADLKNILNEAALLAARQGKGSIDNEVMEEAKDKILMGLVRQGLALTDDEKQLVAYHESGHALVGASLPNADPVHKVSIVPRSKAMGVTQQLPEREKYIYRKEYLLDRLAVMLGGRCAEEIVFNTTTSGASNDLQQATKTARQMVLEWGMSGRFEHMALGGQSEEVFLGQELGKTREYSESTAQEVDAEVERLLKDAFERAKKILQDSRSGLDRLAQMLVDEEEIPGSAVYNVLQEGS
jgi:cell division protease FtsH